MCPIAWGVWLVGMILVLSASIIFGIYRKTWAVYDGDLSTPCDSLCTIDYLVV